MSCVAGGGVDVIANVWSSSSSSKIILLSDESLVDVLLLALSIDSLLVDSTLEFSSSTGVMAKSSASTTEGSEGVYMPHGHFNSYKLTGQGWSLVGFELWVNVFSIFAKSPGGGEVDLYFTLAAFSNFITSSELIGLPDLFRLLTAAGDMFKIHSSAFVNRWHKT